MTPLTWSILAVAIACSLLIFRQVRLGFLQQRLSALQETLLNSVGRHFLVQPCSRCQESDMRLLSCSPHAKSVQYECLHCGKKNHSPAGTPEAGELKLLLERFDALRAQLNQNPEDYPLEFSTPEAALPYEQTTRSPIPEAVRAEVWRRDMGCCVTCGSKENLQFDHIIPLAKGGASSVQNLQVLCGACNRSKGDKI
jgi:hypothetical protein